MPVLSPIDGYPGAGRFGLDAYADWRATSLGDITESLERELILRLAGGVAGYRVLDVGCGDGSLTRALLRYGARRVIGCDIDPRMVARAGAAALDTHAPISYVVADAERLPFSDGTFDLVTIATVLQFLPEVRRAIREMARVLKPVGRIVIGDLGKWNLRAWRARATTSPGSAS